MSRIRFSILTLLLSLAAATASAMDIKAKVTAIDLDKQTITVKGDDDPQTFDISKDVKIYRFFGGGARGGYNEVAGGLKTVTVGATVTLSTDFIDGKEQAIRIKLESGGSGPPPRMAIPKRNQPDKKPTTTKDVKGTVSALDAKSLQMTLKVDGKPQKFTVEKDCKTFVSRPGSTKLFDVAPDGLKDIKVGLDVTITVDSASGKDLVTMVKINTPKK